MADGSAKQILSGIQVVVEQNSTDPASPPSGSDGIRDDAGRLRQVDSSGTASDIRTTPWIDTSSSDSSAVLNTAFATAATRGDAGVEIPDGTSYIKGTVTVPTGMSMWGLGRGRSTIKIDDSSGNIGDGIQLLNTFGCKLQDFTINALSGRTAGNAIRIIGGGTQAFSSGVLNNAATIIEDVDLESQFYGIVIENSTSPARRNWRVYVRGGAARSLSNNGVGIHVNCAQATGTEFGASHFIDGFYVTGPDTATPLAGIRVTNTGDATFNKCVTVGGSYGMLIDPASGGFLTTIRANQCQFDTSSISGLKIVPHASVSAFGDLRFSDCWLSSSDANSCAQIIGAKADRIFFTNTIFYRSLQSCAVTVNAATNVGFDTCDFSATVLGGVYFLGNAAHFNVVNCTAGKGIVGNGASVSNLVGVNVASGCDNYTIALNDFSDTTNGITNTPGTSATRILANNR